MRLIGVALLGCFALAVGCCPQLNLTRRFASFEWRSDPGFEPVRLETTVTETEHPAVKVAPAVLQLSDRAQAHWIDALAATRAPKGDLLGELARPFPSPKQEPPTIEDACEIEKRLVLSTKIDNAARSSQSDDVTPADRITSLEIHLIPMEGTFTFVNWNRFGTEYGDIDLGKVTRDRTNTFSAKLAPTLGGEIVGTGEVSAGSTTVAHEELVLKERIIKLSGILTPGEAVIRQQGGLGLDLEGNVAVDLAVRLPGTPMYFVSFGRLFDDQGAAVTPGKVAAKFIRRWVPAYLDRDVTADVWSDYEFRHVHKGFETVIEGDDAVTLYSGRTERGHAQLLAKGRVHEMARYYDLLDGDRAIQVGSEQGVTVLRFGSEGEGREFLEWLSAIASKATPRTGIRIGSAPNDSLLYIGRYALTPDRLSKSKLDVNEHVNTAVSPRQ